MAEENTDIPVAAETSGDEGSQEESFDIPVVAVAEISEPEDISEESIDDILAIPEEDESERSSVVVIVDIDAPKIGRKIPSRYLLPSTGSCHDFCKYGMKHPLEGKPASPFLKKVKTVEGDGRDLRRIMSSLAKQNKDAISTKSSPDYNAINNTDLKEDIRSSLEIVTLSPKRLLPSIKEMQAAAVHYSRTKLNLSRSRRSSFAGQGSSRTKRNKEVQRGQKEQDGDGSSSSRTNSTTSRCQEIDIFEEEDMKALVPQAISWTPRNHVKRVAGADKTVIARRRLKNQSYPMKNKLVPSKNEEVEEKTLYMIEPSTKNETEEFAQNSVHTTELSQPQSSSAKDNGLKHEQEADGTTKVPQSVKKTVRRARNGTSSKNLFTSSSVSRGSKGLRPKRSGVIQRSEIQSAPSSPSSSRCQAEPIHGERGGRTPGKDVKKSEHSKVEHKVKTRRTMYDSENGDFQSRKLKFRKGRFVELQPENNAPRRLKFLSDSENGDSQSRKLKLRKGRLAELQPENNSPRRPKFLSDSENGDSQPRKLKLRKGRLAELQPQNNAPRTPKFLSDSENGDFQSRKLKLRKGRLAALQPQNNEPSPKFLSDSETGDFQPRKLKFREGTLVEPQPENNAPRRLKFRRARLLGETQTPSPKTDSRRRNFQGKEANQNGDEAKETENSSSRQQDQDIKRKKSFRRKETIDGKIVSSRTKSERVVLRHQDSRGKKQIQNLFNNVIEETASKLAQTRKSKVKALVGAFETVISLQDTKPSATVA